MNDELRDVLGRYALASLKRHGGVDGVIAKETIDVLIGFCSDLAPILERAISKAERECYCGSCPLPVIAAAIRGKTP